MELIEIHWLVGTIKALGGLQFWGAVALVVLAVIFLAYKLFEKTPLWSKSVVLVAILVFFTFITSELAAVAKAGEIKSSPNQRTIDVAYASQPAPEPGSQAKEGWIHCGDFNSANNQWELMYISLTNPYAENLPNNLVGNEAESPITLALLASPPEFSLIDLEWTFSEYKGDLRPYEKIKIRDLRILGKGRVWCQVEQVS